MAGGWASLSLVEWEAPRYKVSAAVVSNLILLGLLAGILGAPSTLPWALELWGELRHPTQVYEIIIAIMILTLLWRIRGWKVFPGFIFLSWLGPTALSRLLIEAFRGDSVIVAGSLRSAQVISLGVLVLVMLGMHVLGRRHLGAP